METRVRRFKRALTLNLNVKPLSAKLTISSTSNMLFSIDTKKFIGPYLKNTTNNSLEMSIKYVFINSKKRTLTKQQIDLHFIATK
ncbi:UNKNOWN [Stylonychia lemnae]|uniref:Uncharacterized protein n=1 Tax=Stylonychia lemnae TaxID=5949 RepID=A0A077ZSH9_STYLE|nr:UNKNOWN [Stylonychia lemnae]|eukprot:CDW72812.1 UNKNOWN [Stylonychia lemnae]